RLRPTSEEKHELVRDSQKAEREPRFGWARTAAGRAGAVYAAPVARAGRLVQRWQWVPGWVFAAVTVAPALLAVAWLAPGIGMLLPGRLLPLPMVIIFVPLAVALCYFAMRRLPARWPGFGASGEGSRVSAVAVLAMV